MTTCLIPVAVSIDSAPESVFVSLSMMVDGAVTDQCIDDSYCNSDVTITLSTCEALVLDETTDIAGNCTHNAFDGGILLEFGQLYATKNKKDKKNKEEKGNSNEETEGDERRRPTFAPQE